jgi:hypothetical protein
MSSLTLKKAVTKGALAATLTKAQNKLFLFLLLESLIGYYTIKATFGQGVCV